MPPPQAAPTTHRPGRPAVVRIISNRRPISLLNGSSLEPFAGREYLGGTSLANTRRIVSRCSPVRRWISRGDSLPTEVQPPDLSPMLHPDQVRERQLLRAQVEQLDTRCGDGHGGRAHAGSTSLGPRPAAVAPRARVVAARRLARRRAAAHVARQPGAATGGRQIRRPAGCPGSRPHPRSGGAADAGRRARAAARKTGKRRRARARSRNFAPDRRASGSVAP